MLTRITIKQGLLLAATFAACMAVLITSYVVTRGFIGEAAIEAPGFSLKFNATGLSKRLEGARDDESIRSTVKSVFNLYDIDADLAKAIGEVDYNTDFAKQIRDMQQEMRGPFYAPQVKVHLTFSDQIGESRARVCADSMFFNQSVTIVTEDGHNMEMIESANEKMFHDCPAGLQDVEKIIVAEQLGMRLSGKQEAPRSIAAIAKAVPTIKFIHLPE